MAERKNIIVGGCSCTAKSQPLTIYPKPLNFKMWPQLISEMTDCNVINTASNGCGNEQIYYKVINEIFKHKKVDTVIVAWTEWTRQDFLTSDGWSSIVPTIRYEYHNNRPTFRKRPVFDELYLQKWYKQTFNKQYPSIENIIQKNVIMFYSLYSICKERNIKLKMFQMLRPVPQWLIKQDDADEYLRNAGYVMIKNPFINILNEKILWGWPCFSLIGGTSITQYLFKKNKWETISDVDGHPNEQTQKNIADLIHMETFL
tara:strand:+ start:1310 stop:2086 length:777 start_codon:yes stop_codon:yes gene_type:complete